ncbi:flagellar assembly protein FliH [Halobacillus dabanensis]|uniref:Flagellar assembly protein FliH n=1 Tax=Halobacillus dabanensis TaxID=240302 RepID=A0A1I3Y6B0_HALDA|nr:flagellar assembly protein FliH [Halobacillus dabanensis]SFK26821.1 flagellar assembly protein FliH [Halobacillus dabanensis]
MTSLSKKPYANTGRVIAIKPIEKNEVTDEKKNQADEHLVKQKQLEDLEKAIEAAKKKQAEIVEATKEEISSLRATWEEEKQVIENEAYQKGYTNGFTKGEEDGYRSYHEKLVKANEIMETARKTHDRLVMASEETIVELGMKSAEKILNKKLQEEPSTFLSLVQRVMGEVKELPEISLYIHPDQFELVHSQAEELERLLAKPAKLAIYINEDLAPFSCTIESPFGKLDGGLDSQLTELREKLLAITHEEMGNE